MLLISAIVGAVDNAKNPNQQLLKKVNDALHLSSSTSSLVVPVMATRFIWKDAGNDITYTYHACDGKSQRCVSVKELSREFLQGDNMRGLASSLLNRTPRWLQYGTHREMRADIVRLFTSMQA